MSKYTDMMRQCEREALTHAASLHPTSEPSKRFATAATDWRAMREAWEEMVEAAEEMVVAFNSGHRMGYSAQKLKSALAKASVE